MEGVLALSASLLAFVVPLALMLFLQRWRAFLVAVAAGVAVFAAMTVDFANGGTAIVGQFLGGLMLFGFAGGTIAKFVMLLTRQQE
jgi:hypothetical protein